MKVQRDITIEAAPEAVWDVLMDPRRLADWVSIHQKLKSAPNGRLEEGDTLVQCLRLMHKNFDVKWKVEQADEPHKAVWEGRGPVRSKAGVVYQLKPDGNGRTRFHYMNEFRAPMGPLGAFFADRAFQRTSEREADKTLDNLKGLLER
ncbi:MAG TPA: SRPBCC family protein [Thermoleophilaceae bacterium]|jgi:carbon monoxide dehydrogenase subunit G|nr:SRPBCC family protein [Thermoleophilaceae bacterium]